MLAWRRTRLALTLRLQRIERSDTIYTAHMLFVRHFDNVCLAQTLK
ncbi:hypothetical protein SAMN04487967_3166 [Natronorubrum sediminis]|uniref:Transposase n=1 Tax=Natronorubrum sediminis TaxID=640943 RepID=A0A1H6G2X3_9EURY|nr:hypothetical protein SAMN04487967_3166 [Natronorubrum sediminis]